mmetsp:Transcript_10420/g.19170  ORF Transcript_10420/g.19170 Transcript_10420/m.19170 type:complete len:534 (+) Transcript_10420:261-1862(+)
MTSWRRVGQILLRWAAVIGLGAVLKLVRLYLADRKLRKMIIQKNPHLRQPLDEFGMFGCLGEVLKNINRFYDFKVDSAEKYGETFIVPTPFYEARVMMTTSNPDNVEYMLKTNFNNFIKGDRLRMILGTPMLGNGIFVVDHGPHASDKGQQWLFQRKISSKIFTRGAFKGRMYDTFCANADILVNRVAATNGVKPIDLEEAFFEFTMDSIGSFGFGVELKTLQSTQRPPFMEAFDKSQKLLMSRILRPGFQYVGRLYPKERELYRHVATMDAFSYKVIEDRLADEKIEQKEDILSNFVLALRASGDLTPTTSKEDIQRIKVLLRDVVMSFFIAGRDTTAASLSFVFLMLCKYPHVQEELYAEICRELNAEPPTELTQPTVQQLNTNFPYLNGVVQETLRLFPPVPSDVKGACEDCTLPDGTFVPKNARLSFEPYVMGRSTRIWGEDAAEFKPTRWLGEDAVNPTPFEMPTFQPGPRQCLGKDLALFETKFVIVELVRRFQFKLAREERDVLYLSGITLTVNGKLPVLATPRKD